MRVLVLFSALMLSGCTFGAPTAQVAPSASGAAATAAVVTVDVNLTLNGQIPTPFGTSQGFRPGILTIPVGTFIRFVNSDGFAHTATSISGNAFPPASPFDTGALTAHGDRLSAGWSAGDLVAGATSPTFLADQPGTYLYGCFFHYGAGMRAEIVVQ